MQSFDCDFALSGGAEIKGYVVFVSVNGSESYEEIASTIDSISENAIEILRLPGQGNRPLQPLSRYDFKAIAVNFVDMCLFLPVNIDAAGFTTVWTASASLPEAPTPPYFFSSTGGRIIMELVEPANMRGSTLRGFSVQVNGSLKTFLAANQLTTYSLDHLYADSTYIVSVSYLTSEGTTRWSDEIEMRTGPISRPSPPTNLSVSMITPSSATIQWSSPLDNGGVTITCRLFFLDTPGELLIIVLIYRFHGNLFFVFENNNIHYERYDTQADTTSFEYCVHDQNFSSQHRRTGKFFSGEKGTYI